MYARGLVNTSPAGVEPSEYCARLGVECPACHARQFLELQLEQPLSDSPVALEIRRQLELWLASHCPDHLGPIMEMSKN